MQANGLPLAGWTVLVAALAFVAGCIADRPSRAAFSSLAGCQEQARAWADVCRETTGMVIVTADCADGRAVLDIELGQPADGERLRVEVRPGPGPGLRTAGPYRLSPVGEFADWGEAPEAMRAALDTLTDCVAVAGASEGGEASAHARVPVLLLGGIFAALLAVALGVGSVPRTEAVLLAGLALGTLVYRALAVPVAHFHQNGQGPLWVEYAMKGFGIYGPGFREVFGLFVGRSSDPDGLVATVQSALAAVVPVAVYVLARATRAPRVVAGVLAFFVVVEPVLARLARSESYFGVWVSLLAVSAALLAAGCTSIVSPAPGPDGGLDDTERRGGAMTRAGRGAALRRAWRGARGRPAVRAAVSVVGAGLLIAQAARVHPVGWPAAALLPLVVLTLRGDWGRRLRCAAATGVGIGTVVAITSLPSMLAVLSGALGANWMPAAAEHRWDVSVARLAGLAGAALVAGGLGATRYARARMWLASWADAGAVAAVGALAMAAYSAAAMLSTTPMRVSHAEWLLYVWVPIAALASLSGRLSGRSGLVPWLVVAASAVTFGLFHAPRWGELTLVPTDVQGAAFVRSWRDELPAGATVFAVERAGNYVCRLPIYDGATSARLEPIRPGRSVPAGTTPASDRYWYRSSICSTPPGEAACAIATSGVTLEPVHLLSIPAIPSMPHLPYASDPVEVGLYRIVGVR